MTHQAIPEYQTERERHEDSRVGGNLRASRVEFAEEVTNPHARCDAEGERRLVRRRCRGQKNRLGRERDRPQPVFFNMGKPLKR
jgi:hypothetical protein